MGNFNSHHLKFDCRSIESIEGKAWGEADQDSYLVRTCCKLAKKQLGEFTIEDLRIMIGQEIALSYLMPYALEKLAEDIVAEGHYYPGDLLVSVLNVSNDFWEHHSEYLNFLKALIEKQKTLLFENQIDYKVFLKLHYEK
ncbi:MAG: contact-dependent growth inhibition system immunity protein [Bacteroidetes bacterium]|nr:contact-dependent growth inhibition system immunity protein [Bacteroidota bacterium]